MKKWLCLAIVAVLLTVSVLPSAAAFKAVNNDVEGEKPFLLTDCDDASAWSASAGVEVSLDKTEKTEGTGSIKFVTDLAAHSNATLAFQTQFLEAYMQDSDFITFDLYISHPDVIYATYQSSAIIGSNGLQSQEIDEWQAALFMIDYVAGWNTVTLPLGGVQTSRADRTEIDNFRMQFRSINVGEDIADLTIRIDNIRVHSYGSKAISFIDCDVANNWSGVDDIDTQDHIQGEGALVFYVAPANVEGEHNLVRQCVLPVGIDCSNADYLEFDLYVSDVAALRASNSNYGLIFEITSSGRCDVEEYTWGPDHYLDRLKDGWNHVKLPIASAGTSGGAPYMQFLNYFRLHLLNLQTARDNLLTIKLDNIYLSVTQDGIDDNAPQTTPEEPDTPENTDTPDVPDTPVNPDTPDTPDASDTTDTIGALEQESAARKKLTTQRAKSLAIIFVFAIIGADIVVVALRRREACEEVGVSDPVKVLQDAEQNAEQNAATDAPAAEQQPSDATDTQQGNNG